MLTHPQNRRAQHAPVLNPSQKRGGQYMSICNRLSYRYLRTTPCCPPAKRPWCIADVQGVLLGGVPCTPKEPLVMLWVGFGVQGVRVSWTDLLISPSAFTEKPPCWAFWRLTRQRLGAFCPFSLPRQHVESGAGAIICKRGMWADGPCILHNPIHSTTLWTTKLWTSSSSVTRTTIS